MANIENNEKRILVQSLSKKFSLVHSENCVYLLYDYENKNYHHRNMYTIQMLTKNFHIFII